MCDYNAAWLTGASRTRSICLKCAPAACVFRVHILSTYDRDQRQASSAVRLVGTCCEILFVRASIQYTPDDDLVTADEHELSCRFVMLRAKPSMTTLTGLQVSRSKTDSSLLQTLQLPRR